MKKKINIGNVLILTVFFTVIGYLTIDKIYGTHDRILNLLSKSSMVYVTEPPGQDYWQTVKETEQFHSGDCEDMALYLFTKLEEKGYDPKLRVGILDNNATNMHMWVEIEYYGREYILDPTANAIFEKRDPLTYIDIPIYLFRQKIQEWKVRNELKETDSWGENRDILPQAGN